MNPNDWGPLFDEALLLYIATFLMVKGMMLRRRTQVGRALARNNFAIASAYYGAFLGTVLGIPFFQTDAWRWFARTVIAVTLTHAIWSMAAYFGGWRGIWREFVLTLQEFRDTWCEVAGMACYRLKQAWRRRWARVVFLVVLAGVAMAAATLAR